MNRERASRAVDVLMEEHREIERVLAALREIASHAVSTLTPPDPQTLELIVHFAEKFADGRHHEKEEKVLFTEMHARGFGRDNGPLACMIKQHESGRGLVAVMRRYCQADADQRKQQLETVLRAAFGYVDLLSSHIMVEDSVLFPAALAHLPNDALTRVAAAYRIVDPPTWREEIRAAADEIEKLGRAVWDAEKLRSGT